MIVVNASMLSILLLKFDFHERWTKSVQSHLFWIINGHTIILFDVVGNKK